MSNISKDNRDGINGMQSIFNNVPMDIVKKLKEYRTERSVVPITWRGRSPKDGKEYGFGGNLPLEDAKTATLYVPDKFDIRSVRRDLEESKGDLVASRSMYDKLCEDHNGLVLENESFKKDEIERNAEVVELTKTKNSLALLLNKFINLSSHKNVHDAIAELSYCKGLKDMFTHQQNMASIVTSISAKAGGVKGA